MNITGRNVYKKGRAVSDPAFFTNRSTILLIAKDDIPMGKNIS